MSYKRYVIRATKLHVCQRLFSSGLTTLIQKLATPVTILLTYAERPKSRILTELFFKVRHSFRSRLLSYVYSHSYFIHASPDLLTECIKASQMKLPRLHSLQAQLDDRCTIVWPISSDANSWIVGRYTLILSKISGAKIWGGKNKHLQRIWTTFGIDLSNNMDYHIIKILFIPKEITVCSVLYSNITIKFIFW